MRLDLRELNLDINTFNDMLGHKCKLEQKKLNIVCRHHLDIVKNELRFFEEKIRHSDQTCFKFEPLFVRDVLSMTGEDVTYF